MISNEWLAGFIDGEGCIGFTVSGKNLNMIPRIIITNTNLQVLQQIQTQFGGYMCKHKSKTGWKQGYGLQICNRKATILLDAIYPHLVIKIPQANLIYEYQKVRPGYGKPLDRELMATFKEQMHILNRKGVLDAGDP